MEQVSSSMKYDCSLEKHGNGKLSFPGSYKT